MDPVVLWAFLAGIAIAIGLLIAACCNARATAQAWEAEAKCYRGLWRACEDKAAELALELAAVKRSKRGIFKSDAEKMNETMRV